MGSAKKILKKVGKSVGIGGDQKAADTVAMAEIATGRTVKSMTDELSGAAAQVTAQKGAAAARKRRRGFGGQRSLLYASRLGGQAGEDQNTLGSA